MSMLDRLAASAGRWRGRNVLQDPLTGGPEESTGTATVTPVLNGRFVRLHYTWGYKGKPQEGTLLMGFDGPAEQLTAHWADTWHMSDKVMAFTGLKPSGSTLAVTGSYAAPPGPDWGWRMEITPGADALHFVMINIWPEGKEELAAEANYTRDGKVTS